MLKRLSRIALVSMFMSLGVVNAQQDASEFSTIMRGQSTKLNAVEAGSNTGRKPTVLDVEVAEDEGALPASAVALPSEKTVAASSWSSASPTATIGVGTRDTAKESQPANELNAAMLPAKAFVPNAKASIDPAATSPAIVNPGATSNPAVTTTATTAVAAPTAMYRVGEGDVLDIRITNINEAGRNDATFHTVMGGGTLDYPLVGEPLAVANLTTDDIDLLITKELKRRAILNDPNVVVSVREYASHVVMVSGLVDNPGTKILRREALPLYVVLAEAQPRPEAGQANIVSTDGATRTIDLTDSDSPAVLVRPGDVVRVVAAPPAAAQFFFVGGEVAMPGQKDFHKGLTLTQAIFAAGGATSTTREVRVLRNAKDNRLVTTEYDLSGIEGGKIPDPAVEAGDRIELGRRRRR
ncbi:MAG: polysaccharide biosynthesis/export family protein [Pyrinomonadaceae bacterium MAG19_C2-C3]|nr:polysaccharide biosynthesis/export family protein [Pyrinomonadaceae bacterium MAG19_C2-C3]